MSVGSPKRRVLQKLQIESDELMAAAIGDLAWLQQSLQKAKSTTQTDKHGFTVIHLAALHGRLECLKLLVEKYNVNVDLPSSTGWRPIHLVLNRECGPSAMLCLKYLLEKGAKVNIQNETGVTPLHQAASEGLLDCMAMLIEAGADVHAKDQDRHRPIDYCKLWGHRKCARYLNDRMWRKDKEEFAHQLHKLNELKCQMMTEELTLKEKYMRDRDYFSQLAFSDWIDNKCLPAKLKKVPLHEKKETPSMEELTNRLKEFLTTAEEQDPKKAKQPAEKKEKSMARVHAGSSVPQKEEKMRGDPNQKKEGHFPKDVSDKGNYRGPIKEPVIHMHSAMNQPSDEALVQTSRQPWNISVNPSTPPVTSIYRPVRVRLGIDPDDCPGDHDFKAFLHLSKNELGESKVRTVCGGRASPLPLLPFEVLRDNLFPSSLPNRIKVPDGFKSRCILNVPRKRLPSDNQRPWSEVALHLCEKLDGRPGISSPTSAIASSNNSPSSHSISTTSG